MADFLITDLNKGSLRAKSQYFRHEMPLRLFFVGFSPSDMNFKGIFGGYLGPE